MLGFNEVIQDLLINISGYPTVNVRRCYNFTASGFTVEYYNVSYEVKERVYHTIDINWETLIKYLDNLEKKKKKEI